MNEPRANAQQQTSRIPPQALEAERAVLGAILLKPACWAEVSLTLEPDDLYPPAHREIWSAMQAIDSRRVPIDLVALEVELKERGVLGRLEGGAEYLMQLAREVPTAENIDHYARIVRNKAVHRRAIAVAGEFLEKAWLGAGDPSELLEQVSKELFALTNRFEPDYVHVRDLIGPTIEEIDRRQKSSGKVTGISTGLWKLDDITGGLQPGQLWVIGARPSIGKTSLVCNWARRLGCEAGGNALIFSLEMNRLELMEKFFSDLASVDNRRIRRGAMDNQTWTAVYEAARRLYDAGIWIDDRTFEVDRIRAKARRWRARHPSRSGLMVVDYLQLGKIAAQKGQTREQVVAEISRGLKELAKELQIPIVALSQLNRKMEEEKRPPRMSDLRDSGQVEQDADVILLMHGDGTPSENAQRGEITIIVAKHRGGDTGEFPVKWEARFTRFSDLEPAEEPQQEDFFDRGS